MPINDKLFEELAGSFGAPDSRQKPAESGGVVGADTNVRRFLDFLGKAEGADYNTIVGGKRFDDFSGHPRVVGMRTAEGPSTAAGKYQITKTTYDDFAPRLGISDFSPESQDRIALEIIKQEGALGDVAAGNFDAAIAKLGRRWASLPSSPYSQPKRSAEWTSAQLEGGGSGGGGPVVIKRPATRWMDDSAMPRDDGRIGLEAETEARRAGPSVGDYGKAFVASAASGVGDMARGIVGEPLAWLANKVSGSQEYEGKNLMDGVAEHLRESMTQGGKYAREDVPSGNLFEPETWKLPDTTAGMLMIGADGLGSLVPSVLPFVGMASKAARLSAAAGAAQKAGKAAEAADLMVQANRASRIAKGAGAASGFGMTGGAAAGEARKNAEEAIASASHDELMAGVPLYREAFEETGDEQIARAAVVNGAGQYATLTAGAMGAVGGAVNAKLLEDVLVKRGLSAVLGSLSGSKIVKGTVGAGAGVVGEGGQEVSEKFGQNVGENVALGRPAMQDAGRDTFGDFVGGALVGGPVGAVGGGASLANPAERQPPAPQPNSPLTNAANAAAAAAPQVPQASVGASGGDLAVLFSQRDQLDTQISNAQAQLEMARQGGSAEAAQALSGRLQELVAQRDTLTSHIGTATAFGAANPTATPAEPVTDPLAERLQAIAPIMEDKELFRALRSDERFGKEAVTDILAAYAKARNPLMEEVSRAWALQDVEEFIQSLGKQPDDSGGGAEGAAGPTQGGPTPPTPPGPSGGTVRERDYVGAPSGSFGNMAEFEGLLGQERADAEQRRSGIAEKQALRRDVETQDADARVQQQRERETAQARRAILDDILADPATANPHARFFAELQRQGFRDPVATPEEMAAIERFGEARETFGDDELMGLVDQERDDLAKRRTSQPSAPNEFDPYDQRKPRKQNPPKVRISPKEAQQHIAAGATLDGTDLVMPDGERVGLEGNVPALAAARNAVKRNFNQAGAEVKGNGAAFTSETNNATQETAQQPTPAAEPLPAGGDGVAQGETVAQGQVEKGADVQGDGPSQWHDSGDVIARYAGGTGKGLNDVSAKVEASKYRKKYPGAVVSIEDAGWTLSNGSPAKTVVVRQSKAADISQGESPQPAAKDRELSGGQPEQAATQQPAASPIDAELKDALAHLGDVLADVFPGNLKAMPGQYNAGHLLPALAKVVELLVRKGFRSFGSAVGNTAKAMRSNPATAQYVDQISPRQWKAAYNAVAEFHDGTDSEEAVAALAADEVKGFASGLIASDIDAAAHQSATSPLNGKAEPTEAQKKAGNYALGPFRLAGMEGRIENPQGSVRKGVGPDGKPWQTTMHSHYGFIRNGYVDGKYVRTKGADGDAVDVFIKPGTPTDYAGPVFVVDQKNADGSFDEHKALVGWDNESEARAAYLANYSAGWDGIGAITAMPMEGFKAWLLDGKQKRKPLSYVEQVDSFGAEQASEGDDGLDALLGTPEERAQRLAAYMADEADRREGLARIREENLLGNIGDSIEEADRKFRLRMQATERARTVPNVHEYKTALLTNGTEYIRVLRADVADAIRTLNGIGDGSAWIRVNERRPETGTAPAPATADKPTSYEPQDTNAPEADPLEFDGVSLNAIPPSFMRKQRVAVEVFVEETGRVHEVEMPADKAVAMLKDELDGLRALLNCVKG